MNTWGPGSWDNEAALDLLSDLLDSSNANTLLDEALSAASPHADLVASARAVAAADLAAATRGRPGIDLPEDARELIGLFLVFASDETLARAATAVRAVGTEGTALRAHWRASADGEQWTYHMGLLEARLAELIRHRG